MYHPKCCELELHLTVAQRPRHVERKGHFVPNKPVDEEEEEMVFMLTGEHVEHMGGFTPNTGYIIIVCRFLYKYSSTHKKGTLFKFTLLLMSADYQPGLTRCN